MDAGAYNMSFDKEQLSVLCANYDRRIDALAKENAKLRERVAELEELLPDSGRWYRAETVEAYVTEIAKLRELVRDMAREHECCYLTWSVTIADRMRELGLEDW